MDSTLPSPPSRIEQAGAEMAITTTTTTAQVRGLFPSYHNPHGKSLTKETNNHHRHNNTGHTARSETALHSTLYHRPHRVARPDIQMAATATQHTPRIRGEAVRNSVIRGIHVCKCASSTIRWQPLLASVAHLRQRTLYVVQIGDEAHNMLLFVTIVRTSPGVARCTR